MTETTFYLKFIGIRETVVYVCILTDLIYAVFYVQPSVVGYMVICRKYLFNIRY